MQTYAKDIDIFVENRKPEVGFHRQRKPVWLQAAAQYSGLALVTFPQISPLAHYDPGCRHKAGEG